ncbi:hypothetical protein [Noviherbaspirillum sp. UKPF54]|uniref:hypothetical protein n=1 Tax=Noviherbaspirillum sp. UKPF54 TaxID=2601898 RepID=UPI0011B0F963|nr:hypothetical protein [Noviherbaspirillum sp. UKPF54]QDZ29852.1 hypothetical protein FAY22_18920 [Noviherbaspirillum sp. UKPF54]
MMVLLMAASCWLAAIKEDMNMHRRISSEAAASGASVSFSARLVKMDGVFPGARRQQRKRPGLLLACPDSPFD